MQLGLDAECEARLDDLPLKSATSEREGIAGELLRDRRASLADAAEEKVANGGSGDADGVDAVVGEKAVVFARDQGVDEVGRDAVKGRDEPILPGEAAVEFSISIEDDGSLRKVVDFPQIEGEGVAVERDPTETPNDDEGDGELEPGDEAGSWASADGGRFSGCGFAPRSFLGGLRTGALRAFGRGLSRHRTLAKLRRDSHKEKSRVLKIQILTLFPGICHGALGESMMKRAADRGLAELEAVDLREWTTGRHRVADGMPYGGGPGMVMRIEPIYRALADLRTPDSRVVLMTPQGRVFDQPTARRVARDVKHLILLCGHYEGVDQRVADHLIDDEWSIGDYVLTNGALAALVVTDAVVRLLPGVLGDEDSSLQDSFGEGDLGILDHPHFTRPEEFAGWRVPDVLKSGNHAAIAAWRRERALAITRERRPDLLGGQGS